MKKTKQIISIVLTMVMCMSFSMVVFASSSYKDVPGYIRLEGTISTSLVNRVNTYTKVTTNPDSAYLNIKIDAKNFRGTTISSQSDSSSAGITGFTRTFLLASFTNVDSIVGSHSVQGGRTYPAQVVYTVTYP